MSTVRLRSWGRCGKGVRGSDKDSPIILPETQAHAGSTLTEFARKAKTPTMSSCQSRNPREKLLGSYCVYMIIVSVDTQVSSGSDSGVPISQKNENYMGKYETVFLNFEFPLNIN